MPDVFISYSRKDLLFVKQLISELEAKGKSVWWDKKREALEGILVGSPWWEQIKVGIETADNFLFVISPNSIVSPYCHAEINHARWYGKRLVTALYCSWVSEEDTWKAIGAALDAISDADQLPDEVTHKPVNLRSLARQNWLSLNEIQHAIFTSSNSFEEPFKQLVKAFDQDFAWVKMYSRVRQAALLWDENGRSNDFLWPHGQLKPVHEMIERRKPELDVLVQEFIQPEQQRLWLEIEDIQTDHRRRRWIGERLAEIGDHRPHVGVDTNGVPDIEWLPLQGGEIEIEYRDFVVKPFWISRYLITYWQFQAFCGRLEVYDQEQWWRGMPGVHWRQEVVAAREQYDNYPRDSVSWYQAVAFTRWLQAQLKGMLLIFPGEGGGAMSIGKTAELRLPTEWEWQWAAQNGYERREYPWGAWDNQPRANTSEARIGDQSMAVGLYPHGAAACGALDMAGNLWEWCLNEYYNITQISLDNDHGKVLRGGSFLSTRRDAAASSRLHLNPSSGYDHFGFRVVVSSPIQAI